VFCDFPTGNWQLFCFYLNTTKFNINQKLTLHNSTPFKESEKDDKAKSSTAV
jgi:hypothetical protein